MVSTYAEDTIAIHGVKWRRLAYKVLMDCESPPRGEPQLDTCEVDLVAFHISNAIRDCLILDGLEGGAYFSNRFAQSLEDSRAYAGIAWQALSPGDKRKTQPLHDAVADGPEAYEVARVLYDLREHVRDGMPVRDAFALISKRIARVTEFDSGFTFFSEKLPKSLKDIVDRPERYRRGTKDWITRAWVPLALWMEIDDPQAVHDVLMRAKSCYPPVRTIRFEYERDFLGPWGKVKPTRKRR